MHTAASGVIFGLNPLWLATVVMIVTYGVIISERLNRSIIALLGAMLMIMFGLLTQEQAVAGVDFNTIGLLVGMMIIVSITRKTGVFEYLAIRSAKLRRVTSTSGNSGMAHHRIRKYKTRSKHTIAPIRLYRVLKACLIMRGSIFPLIRSLSSCYAPSAYPRSPASLLRLPLLLPSYWHPCTLRKPKRQACTPRAISARPNRCPQQQANNKTVKTTCKKH